MEKWQSLSIEQTEEKLNTSATHGISGAEAERILKSDAYKNKTPLYCANKKNILSCIFTPFFSISIVIYIVISGFAFFNGQKYFGLWTLVLLFAQLITVGIMNLYAVRKKEKSNLYSVPNVKVIRSGVLKHTYAGNIARGDLVVFEMEDTVTCDTKLCECDSLVVDEFSYENNKLVRRRIKKSMESDNILLAGSVIVSGKGKGIAFATGADVCLCKYIRNGEMSGDIKRPVGIHKLLDTTRKFGVVCAFALVIMVLFGMILLRRYDFFEVFLLCLSSFIYLTSSGIDTWSRYIFASAVDSLSEGIVIKNNRSFDVLTGYTDIFLLGKSGICDGKLHISSLFLSGRKLDIGTIEGKPDRTHRLCECIYTYFKIVPQSAELSEADMCRDGFEAFLRRMNFDCTGADLKINSLYYLENEDKLGFACAESLGTDFRIAMSFEPYVVSKCKYLRVGDMSVPLDSQLKHRIIDYIDECENSGEKLVFVLSEEIEEGKAKGENIVLEGIMALEEHIVYGLEESLNTFRGMGISVTSLMSDESVETIKYLVTSGIISSSSDPSIAFASDFRSRGLDITHDLGKYRAYAGFDTEEYATLINAKKASGSVIVSYGVEDIFNNIAVMSDAYICCSDIPYDKEEYMESVYEKFPDCGRNNSSNPSQRGRLCASVLIKRLGKKGGLSGLLKASDISCTSYINISYYLKYFMLGLSVIFPLVFLSVCSGIVLINSIQILAVYLLMCTAGLYAFSQNIPRDELLRKNKRGYAALPLHIMNTNLPHFVFRICGIALYFVISLVLVLTGVISKEGISFSSFVGLFILEVFDIFSISREYSNKNRKRGKIIRIVLLFMLGMLLIVLAICALYIIDAVFEGDYRSKLSLPTQILSVIYGGQTDIVSLVLIPVFLIINVTVDTVDDKVSHRVKAKIKSAK